MWVVDADIKGAFDNSEHAYVLDAIGEIPGRDLIKQWRKAGYVEHKRWHPTDAGTPHGGVISPLLANIALHGMEEALGIRYRHQKDGERNVGSRALVRYADDFVVLCESREDAERVIDILKEWLAIRGLTFSVLSHNCPTTTSIVMEPVGTFDIAIVIVTISRNKKRRGDGSPRRQRTHLHGTDDIKSPYIRGGAPRFRAKGMPLAEAARQGPAAQAAGTALQCPSTAMTLQCQAWSAQMAARTPTLRGSQGPARIPCYSGGGITCNVLARRG